jgi:ankyrin repeat protein
MEAVAPPGAPVPPVPALPSAEAVPIAKEPSTTDVYQGASDAAILHLSKELETEQRRNAELEGLLKAAVAEAAAAKEKAASLEEMLQEARRDLTEARANIQQLTSQQSDAAAVNNPASDRPANAPALGTDAEVDAPLLSPSIKVPFIAKPHAPDLLSPSAVFAEQALESGAEHTNDETAPMTTLPALAPGILETIDMSEALGSPVSTVLTASRASIASAPIGLTSPAENEPSESIGEPDPLTKPQVDIASLPQTPIIPRVASPSITSPALLEALASPEPGSLVPGTPGTLATDPASPLVQRRLSVEFTDASPPSGIKSVRFSPQTHTANATIVDTTIASYAASTPTKPNHPELPLETQTSFGSAYGYQSASFMTSTSASPQFEPPMRQLQLPTQPTSMQQGQPRRNLVYGYESEADPAYYPANYGQPQYLHQPPPQYPAQSQYPMQQYPYQQYPQEYPQQYSQQQYHPQQQQQSPYGQLSPRQQAPPPPPAAPDPSTLSERTMEIWGSFFQNALMQPPPRPTPAAAAAARKSLAAGDSESRRARPVTADLAEAVLVGDMVAVDAWLRDHLRSSAQAGSAVPLSVPFQYPMALGERSRGAERPEMALPVAFSNPGRTLTSPLHLACLIGRSDVLGLLLDAVDASWQREQDALEEEEDAEDRAAGAGSTRRIPPIDTIDESGNTPLLVASLLAMSSSGHQGHIDCVKLLLQSAASVSQANIYGADFPAIIAAASSLSEDLDAHASNALLQREKSKRAARNGGAASEETAEDVAINAELAAVEYIKELVEIATPYI